MIMIYYMWCSVSWCCQGHRTTIATPTFATKRSRNSSGLPLGPRFWVWRFLLCVSRVQFFISRKIIFLGSGWYVRIIFVSVVWRCLDKDRTRRVERSTHWTARRKRPTESHRIAEKSVDQKGFGEKSANFWQICENFKTKNCTTKILILENGAKPQLKE